MTFMNLVRVQGIITEIAEREKIRLIQKKREPKIHEEEDSFKIKIPFFQLNSIPIHVLKSSRHMNLSPQ